MDALHLEPHRRHLWGLCYRMTGSAADADDLVQDTFTRALTRPPPDTDRTLRPWLTRVAVNLAKDALRRRQAKSYVGPWLPAPILTGDEPASAEGRLDDGQSTAGRYSLMESVSLAFLVALEALTPKQRAVLLLRDVFDYSGAEAAAALDLSISDVKVSLHRARGRLAAYDAVSRPGPRAGTVPEALARLVAALGAEDHAAVQSILTEEAEVFSDGGGEFLAALRVVRGAPAAARLLHGLSRRRPARSVAPVALNGGPGLIVDLPPGGPRDAPRVAVSLDVEAAGRIRSVFLVSATPKLSAATRPGRPR